jgi:Domain of unknown function (DUF4276)
MYIEFLLEEYSAKVALDILLPKILPTDWTWDLRYFRGKTELLKKLPPLLKSYATWIPSNHYLVVLVDRDREDCHQLKADLEKIAASAGLITKTSANAESSFQVLNRIAIEELEAWFFGDVDAICSAYPGVSKSLAQQNRFRNPDGNQQPRRKRTRYETAAFRFLQTPQGVGNEPLTAIQGGTAEALEQVLMEARHHLGGLEKVGAARDIAYYMEPGKNRSPSFQAFLTGLQALVES